MTAGRLAANGHVAVIGLGYVGLPLAIAFAEAGVPVIGVDSDPDLVKSLQSGDSHVSDISVESFAAALNGNLRISMTPEDLGNVRTYIICVPTPLSEAGEPNLAFVESAADYIAPYLNSDDLVILESTSYPGTTEEVVKPRLESGSGLKVGVDLKLAFSPERVDPGNSEFRVTNTPKIVAGWDRVSQQAAAELYARICDEVVLASGLREAELAKLLENTYRQVNIALMNELVKFCHELKIDLYEAIRCASTKPFGFQAFYPGPGVGGHCIPIDPKYLASRVRTELGSAFRFIELAQEINDGMPAYVVDRLDSVLADAVKTLAGARVLLLGVTYKRDVADVRESPSEDVVRHLRSKGSEVFYLDPHVGAWAVDGVPVQSISLERARAEQRIPFDACVLVQNHSAFSSLDIDELADVCLDTRGVLTGKSVVRL
jgi:nucleotide sugar dehydrogenase